MPELPDVAMVKRYLDATGLHQEVTEVEVRDDYVLKGVSPDRLADAARGSQFCSSTRHGKNLLVELTGGPWLRLHFGMTGNLKYFKRLADDPEYDRILLTFGTGYHLAYVCQRKLGRVSLAESPEQFVSEEGIGPDALEIGREQFADLLIQRRGALKARLMDQHLIAGLGNIYSDEVLFRARLHPRQEVEELSRGDLRRLHAAMRKILETSLERGADARDLPRTWLIHHRYHGAECPRCGDSIRRMEVNQRGCYFCPACQGRSSRPR
ncbi:MAG: DNA-formamidopyrimidine glycosylase family protein [Candidatus Brocadiaceae bacterium]|jgi:formamidopyrimidine-DNA glycosylase